MATSIRNVYDGTTVEIPRADAEEILRLLYRVEKTVGGRNVELDRMMELLGHVLDSALEDAPGFP